MNWKERGYGILAVFFYGMGGSIVPIGAFISATNPLEFTLYNLIVWPSLGGLMAVIPKLGKTFAELSNEKS